MLSENIKNLRNSKGISQEELAVKLNIVRQTVSKWERSQSVPDSEMLIRIAEELDTTVNVLLGETVNVDEADEIKFLAEKLELINEQFAKRNEHQQKLRKIILTVTAVVAASVLFVCLFSVMQYWFFTANEIQENVSIVGGADIPSAVYVSSVFLQIMPLIEAVIAAAAAITIVLWVRKRW